MTYPYNPFVGIPLWKMVTTLRKDGLREQLLNATQIPLVRAKDVSNWMNNLKNIFKELSWV
jgi:hypothetical protein